MIQGSNMTGSHKGMRKGISLVEMLIAIVLFGLISAIGYKYYKNFFNVGLAAKQARVSAVIDQATQISTAYDLYVIKTGQLPTSMADLSASNIGILSETPVAISEITAAGWVLSSTLQLDASATANDVGFVYAMDAAGLTPSDELDYCNALNNIAKSSWDLNATYTPTTVGEIGTNTDMYVTNALTTMLCGGGGATDLSLTFVKTVNPL